MKTTSKTFPIDSEVGEIIQWFLNQIETQDREIIYNGAEPSMDVIVETINKYTITIKKHGTTNNGI